MNHYEGPLFAATEALAALITAVIAWPAWPWALCGALMTVSAWRRATDLPGLARLHASLAVCLLVVGSTTVPNRTASWAATVGWVVGFAALVTIAGHSERWSTSRSAIDAARLVGSGVAVYAAVNAMSGDPLGDGALLPALAIAAALLEFTRDGYSPSPVERIGLALYTFAAAVAAGQSVPLPSGGAPGPNAVTIITLIALASLAPGALVRAVVTRRAPSAAGALLAGVLAVQLSTQLGAPTGLVVLYLFVLSALAGSAIVWHRDLTSPSLRQGTNERSTRGGG